MHLEITLHGSKTVRAPPTARTRSRSGAHDKAEYVRFRKRLLHTSRQTSAPLHTIGFDLRCLQARLDRINREDARRSEHACIMSARGKSVIYITQRSVSQAKSQLHMC